MYAVLCPLRLPLAGSRPLHVVVPAVSQGTCMYSPPPGGPLQFQTRLCTHSATRTPMSSLRGAIPRSSLVSVAFAEVSAARLSFVRLRGRLTTRQCSLNSTDCSTCSTPFRAFVTGHRRRDFARTPAFHQSTSPPVSYEAAWSLTRPDLHRLV